MWLPPKKLWLMLMLAIVGLIVSYVIMLTDFLFNHNYELPSLSCSSKFIVSNEYQPDLKLEVYLNYMLDADSMWMKIDGVLKNKNKTTSVSRQVYFTMSNDGMSYNLRNTKVVKSNLDTTDDSELNEVFPDIYIKENTKSAIFIRRESNGNALFSTGRTPTFYCINDSRYWFG
ncbi:hypothetical protein [Serratia fonticola]|jgi:hypothetical protein|uniref:hypothetical protein n=1 Tax=Serratia fonticola TaxID=47917 RepID=UPI000F9E1BA8|nr:hypothetical protein [Serratia fonticola]CAI1612583.1 Uncharacterised protein [Serratia fonticola]HBE9178075.1 hypothetical protein [Serratia fonticola]